MVLGLLTRISLSFYTHYSELSHYTFSSKIVWLMSFICNLEHSVEVLLDSLRIYFLYLPELKLIFKKRLILICVFSISNVNVFFNVYIYMSGTRIDQKLQSLISTVVPLRLRLAPLTASLQMSVLIPHIRRLFLSSVRTAS